MKNNKKKAPGQKLTEKQRKFVEAYMGKAAGNATEAARIAGYKGSATTLASVGAENLRKPQIKEAVKTSVKSDPLILDRKARMELLSKIASGAVEDVSTSSDSWRSRISASPRPRLEINCAISWSSNDV